MINSKINIPKSINKYLLFFLFLAPLIDLKVHIVIIKHCIVGCVTYIDTICIMIIAPKKGKGNRPIVISIFQWK